MQLDIKAPKIANRLFYSANYLKQHPGQDMTPADYLLQRFGAESTRHVYGIELYPGGQIMAPGIKVFRMAWFIDQGLRNEFHLIFRGPGSFTGMMDRRTLSDIRRTDAEQIEAVKRRL